MPSSQELRTQIEMALAKTNPTALTPAHRVIRRVLPSGSQALDEILKGGLPCGSITEFVGMECSGRTTMALAYIAAITQAGNVCAWIDVADALEPESVASNGGDLERLLWVRCGPRQLPCLQVSEAKADAIKPVGNAAQQRRQTAGGSAHPRSEGRDMPEAIGALLHAHGGLYDRQVRREKKAIGTPGMANRPLSWRSEDRGEQPNSDRLPSRRGDNLTIAPRCAEPSLRRAARLSLEKGLPLNPDPFKTRPPAPANKRWQTVDQALRATDLLLQGGGFTAIVLDLGSTPPEIAWRIPLATWFRFRAACERTQVSLLLLTQHPCARSSAEIVVRLDAGTMDAEGNVMTGIRYRATTERSRSREDEARVVPIRKPPQPERSGQWRSEAAWARMK